MAMKGSHYVGEMRDSFGGFYKDNPQPKGFGKFGGTYGSNRGSMGDPASKKGSLLGKGKFTPTCKSCGGKM